MRWFEHQRLEWIAETWPGIMADDANRKRRGCPPPEEEDDD